MASLRTYYALTKPGIIYGNALSVIGGWLLASRGHVDAGLGLAVVAGASLVMAAACVCNNYLDRGIDARMARTKKRASVTGAVPLRAAMFYAAVLGLLGLALLILYTNALTAGLGVAAFVIYVALYGLAKRRSVHGTLVGSLAGAAPPVAGYTAVTGRLDGGALILFLILVCWQMPHFYAIAIYRFKDYQAAGLPVLPVARGIRTAKIQILLYIVAFIITAVALTAFGYAGYSYAAVMAGLGGLWLGLGWRGWQTHDDRQWARRMFLCSLVIIVTFPVLLSLDAVLP